MNRVRNGENIMIFLNIVYLGIVFTDIQNMLIRIKQCSKYKSTFKHPHVCEIFDKLTRPFLTCEV